MGAIDMPECPECGEDMTMDFGDVEFSNGLTHHFDCTNCDNHEAWDLQEMNEHGVERPSLGDFIDHYDLTLADLRERLSTTELVTFLRSFGDDADEARDRLRDDDHEE